MCVLGACVCVCARRTRADDIATDGLGRSFTHGRCCWVQAHTQCMWELIMYALDTNISEHACLHTVRHDAAFWVLAIHSIGPRTSAASITTVKYRLPAPYLANLVWGALCVWM